MCHLCPHAKLHPLTQPLLAIMVLFGSVAVSTSLSSLHNNQSEPLKTQVRSCHHFAQNSILLRVKSQVLAIYLLFGGVCHRPKLNHRGEGWLSMPQSSELCQILESGRKAKGFPVKLQSHMSRVLIQCA